MKKTITCIMISCMLSIIAIAQETAPKAGLSIRFSPTSNIKINFLGMSDLLVGSDDRIDAELNLGSFTADITGRYYLNEQLAVRLGIGMGSLKIKTYNTYTYWDGDNDVVEGNLQQNRFIITPAVERHFKIKKLEILTGLGLPITSIGTTTANVKATYNYIDPVDTEFYEESVEAPGGFGIGLQSFAGFNFYITNGIAIGTEITYGIGYMKAGGKTIITENDNGTIDVYAGDELTINGFSIFPLNGALVLSVNF